MIIDIINFSRLILLALCIFAPSIYCAEKLDNNELLNNNLRCIEYGNNTLAINTVLQSKIEADKAAMAKSPHTYIPILKAALSSMKNDLLVAEQKQLNAVMQANGLDEPKINQVFSLLNKFHKGREQNFDNPQPKGTHTIDSTLQTIIAQELSKYKIDVASIHLIQEELPGECAEATCPMPSSWDILPDGDIVYGGIIPGSIKFASDFNNQAPTEKQAKAIIAHEVTHFVEGHHLTCFMTIWAIKALTNCNAIKIDQNWHMLKQIHERQAEIFPALKHPETASLLREFRFGPNGTYPGMLYEEHYQQLSEIDETHKMIDYLQNWIPNNASSI